MDCKKVAMILDEDLEFDGSYSVAIRQLCSLCTEGTLASDSPEEAIVKALEEVPKRNYPNECYEGSSSYVIGVVDGLKEALQIVRIKQGKYDTLRDKIAEEAKHAR
jgi:hypothetical protein